MHHVAHVVVVDAPGAEYTEQHFAVSFATEEQDLKALMVTKP